VSSLHGEARARYVRHMFGRIAGRYDLLNRLMTAGQDGRWRAEVIRRLAPTGDVRVLDLGTGTGDLAFEVQHRAPGARTVAADFTPEMIEVGRQRPGGDGVQWLIADALNLPFGSGTFDGLVSGFLLRNVSDVDRALGEQRRVLKSGGRMVCLDTNPPPPGLMRPFIEFHLHRIVPWMGRMIAGDAEAYRYLPDSTEGFLAPEALAHKMRTAGFEGTGYARRMLKTIAIHWGTAA
jgi:demethylmenaquinone methyltransferase/2-methoxy-6-polyprenyl-1,4-benzoquinol methylase